MTLPATTTGLSIVGNSLSVSGRFSNPAAEIVATRWWANGDHPEDRVGEQEIDPSDGTSHQRIEGAVVTFYRHPDVATERECPHCGHAMHEHGWIDTLKGGHIVCPGDWVVTGIQGERHPLKPEIFSHTYEPVTE
jgi:hypothetical protein